MQQQPMATLIGDIVASRAHADRGRLQQDLRSLFESVNATVVPVQPMVMTIGDEFQAVYRSVEAVLEAQFRLAVGLPVDVEVRTGLGWGRIRAFDPQRLPLEQDGPGWWNARRAIETVEHSERSHGSAIRRTAIVTGHAGDDLVNGYLMLRDHLVGRLDAVDRVIVAGILDGETLTVIARRLGLNKSSVSRRASSHGLTALVASRPSVVELGPVVDEDAADV